MVGQLTDTHLFFFLLSPVVPIIPERSTPSPDIGSAIRLRSPPCTPPLSESKRRGQYRQGSINFSLQVFTLTVLRSLTATLFFRHCIASGLRVSFSVLFPVWFFASGYGVFFFLVLEVIRSVLVLSFPIKGSLTCLPPLLPWSRECPGS